MKKIWHDKMLITAIISCALSLFAMIAVGYAWFVGSNEGETDSFVSTIGTIGIQYDFGYVVGNEVNNSDQILIDKVVPGRNHYFYLAVTNVSNVSNSIDVYLHLVTSHRNIEGGLTDDFTGCEEEKIQYAYEYELLEIFWNSNGQSVEVLSDLDDEFPPSNAEIAEWGWTRASHEYVLSVTAESHDYDPTGQHFSLLNDDDTDLDDYYIIENMELDPAGGDYASFVLVFEVRFDSEAVLPDTMSGMEVPSSNAYENQQFWVENIVIKESGEE